MFCGNFKIIEAGIYKKLDMYIAKNNNINFVIEIFKYSDFLFEATANILNNYLKNLNIF
jgi:hypothetical protein